MWLSHFRSWEIVMPRNLNNSSAATVLFMMVSGGRAGGFLLKSTIISTVLSVLLRLLTLLQVVKTAPDSQLLDLLSVSRLVTVLNEANQCGVICKLQELNGGVFRCAVIRVQGEEQWGENTALRSSSADRTGAGWEFSQLYCLLPVCQEAGDPLTDGGGDGELCQFILKGVRDDGVKSGAEVYKQVPWSVQMLQDEVDCIIHRPVCSVGKLQGVQWRPSDKPKPIFQMRIRLLVSLYLPALCITVLHDWEQPTAPARADKWSEQRSPNE